MSTSQRVGVIGAGILGLAVARELTRRHPGLSVTVLEKEARVAAHQSGHNSGVLHAGVYYPPNSLKARLCRRGGALLREFCAEHGVAVADLGKLIVATSAAELDGLATIEQRARANDVPGIRRLSREEMTEVEPYVDGRAAVYSPHTAAVDYVGMCDALVAEITRAGGTVELSTPVTAVTEASAGVLVRSGDRRWTFDRLVVCAGLHSDGFASQLHRRGDLAIVPFRGEYYELRPAARHRVRGMIYPVPDPRYPFLGVHLTRDVHGGVHVGPNAVLALSLEGYRWRDINLRDLGQIVRWPGTWRLVRAHWRSGMDELAGSLLSRRYLAKVRRYLPELTLDDLTRAGAGVRAQAVRRDGRLVDDFVLEPAGAVFLVRNAPSPAATSSLAIAEHIVGAVSL